ncbi:MAG: metal-sulfur cluster assembly factor [Candidatus Nanohalobium sp.]
MTLNKEDVREKLREVMDPELNVNIVDLGLLRTIELDEGLVKIEMTLTTPGCPLQSVFNEMVSQELQKLGEVEEVEVDLTFEPRWTPEDMTEKAKDKVGSIPGMTAF